MTSPKKPFLLHHILYVTFCGLVFILKLLSDEDERLADAGRRSSQRNAGIGLHAS